jgi:hypothetical protein
VLLQFWFSGIQQIPCRPLNQAAKPHRFMNAWTGQSCPVQLAASGLAILWLSNEIRNGVVPADQWVTLKTTSRLLPRII